MNLAAPKVITLAVSNPQTRDVLLTGFYSHGGVKFKALPREVSHAGEEFVVFELRQPYEIKIPSLFQRYFFALRAMSLTATITPCAATLLYGIAHHWPFSLPKVLFAALGAGCLQVGVNVLNDVEDHLKLIDLPGTPGGSGVIQKGWVSALNLRRFGFASVVVGVILGLPALISHFTAILFVGTFALLGTFGYSNWPFRFKYRASGDAVVFLLCGPLLTAGFALAAFGTFEKGVLLLGMFFGFAACGILHANNMEDIEYDISRHSATLASKLGFSKSKYILAAFYILSFAAVVWGVGLRVWGLKSFLFISLALPLIILLNRKAWRASGPASPVVSGLRFDSQKCHLLLGVLFCLSLILAGRA